MPISTIHIISSSLTLLTQLSTCTSPTDLHFTHAKISELYTLHPSNLLLLSILDEIKVRLSQLPPQ